MKKKDSKKIVKSKEWLYVALIVLSILNLILFLANQWPIYLVVSSIVIFILCLFNIKSKSILVYSSLIAELFIIIMLIIGFSKALPQVKNILNRAQINSFRATAKNILSEAEKDLIENPNKEIFKCEDYIKLDDNLYSKCELYVNLDGSMLINLIGNGKYSDYKCLSADLDSISTSCE